MRLKSNNERVTDVELTNNMTHLEYRIDGHFVEVEGTFNFKTDRDGQYEALTEVALVRREECYNDDGTLNEMTEEFDDGGVIEEVEFEAYFE